MTKCDGDWNVSNGKAAQADTERLPVQSLCEAGRLTQLDSKSGTAFYQRSTMHASSASPAAVR